LLDSMRAASQTWFGRVVMGLVMGFIVLSFTVWGIGDIFQGFSSKDLAKVGSTSITVDAYRNAYQFELQRLQQQLKRAVTNEEARAYGIDRQVLSRLISEATLDEKAKDLGLAISDRQIAESIVKDDTFKDASGKFDKMRFESILRENGFTERSFVTQQRDVYLRREIAQSISSNLEVPDVLVDAIHRFQDETRSIDYVVLPPSAAGQIAEPTKDDLDTYYQAHQQSYRTPEYRKVIMLTVSPAKVAAAEKISEDDLKKRYEETKERFTTPETRTIEQIAYPDEPTAQAARSQIDSGKTFQDLAKEKNLTQTDIDLGTVTKASMIDKAVAEAAFALPEGEVSQPVKSRFGAVLLHVTKVNPAKTQPFSDVSNLISQELSVLRSRSTVSKLRDQIEDQRSSGKSLTEAAKSAGLEPETIDAVDATGRDKSGKMIADVATDPAILKAVFASDVGVDNDTIATKDGGTVWFEIASIEPAHQQSLDDVKAQVEKGWKDDETDKKLSEKAVDWINKLKAGETLQKLAESEKDVSVKHADGIKRGGGAGLSQSAVAQVFNVPVKGYESATEGDGRMIFQVLTSTVPPLDKNAPELKSLTDQVKTSLNNEVIGEYLAGLQKTYGLKVNYQALGSAVSSANNY